MMEQGELTAEEQRWMETKLQAKLVREEAKQMGVSDSSQAAEKLRVKLRAVREAKPIVWPVKLAAQIQALETKLAALAKLESPNSPLPLSEVQKLSAKPKLLEELAGGDEGGEPRVVCRVDSRVGCVWHLHKDDASVLLERLQYLSYLISV